jgi:hypothetical protein
MASVYRQNDKNTENRNKRIDSEWHHTIELAMQSFLIIHYYAKSHRFLQMLKIHSKYNFWRIRCYINCLGIRGVLHLAGQ